jgi:intracellular sulfur oxidation DsrE/DsrF family protein
MRWLAWFLVVLLSASSFGAEANDAPLVFPRIKQYGGVVALPHSAEPPRAGAKVVFDITSESPPKDVHSGLERVARYLNLHALAGHGADDLRLALVLHGAATKIALRDEAYALHTDVPHNPNGQLLKLLKAAGVEVFVCGQSLARNKYAVEEVAPDVTVAVSAMTVTVNRQFDGYAYVPVH